MKSKRRKRVIASVLCMVLMLSTGMSTLAEADAGTVPAVEETTAAQTTAQETKSTSTDAQTAETETQTQTETETQTETKQTEEAARTQPEETTAAQPTEEASGGETTQTETDQTAQNTQDQTTSAETSGTETQNEAVETQPKETETTTPTEETQETKEEASVSPAFNETYENSEVTVKVTADEGIVPEGAELSVTPIVKKEITDQMSEEEKAEAKKINDQYDLTEKKLSEDSDKNKEIMEGFLAYDISFLVDGKEVEPSGDVKVVIDFKKAAVPEGVSEDADVAVKHLKEDPTAEDGVVVENMDEKATVKTTEKAEVEKVEFTAGQFSTFIIRWGSSRIVTVHHVDTQGNEIQGKKTNSVDLERGENAVLENYAGAEGYRYLGAHLNSYQGVEIYSIKYSNSNRSEWTYKEREYGRDISWVSTGRGRNVYLVYEVADELTTVKTVDNSTGNITMRMIDYDNNFQDRFNIGGGYGQGNVKQGLLKNVLQNGYPMTTGGRSLQDLFSGGKNVNHLFLQSVYDETGYYEYSSFDNYAYLGDGNNFTVYNQIGTPSDEKALFYQRGNFMPYNPIQAGQYSKNTNLYDEDGNRLSSSDERYNEKLYKTQGTNNFHFGMYMEVAFTQPEDGSATYNGTTSPMIYEFNGDDDLWVYIDDVLVLDIGGIHDAHSGYINFKTGDVHVEHINQNGNDQNTTIKAMYQAAGKFPDGSAWDDAKVDLYFSGNTFKDYTSHNLKMFYMERGEGASNLHMRFNLQTVPEGTIEVTKDLTNTDKEKYANVAFAFQVWAQNITGYDSQGNEVYEDGKYVLLGEEDDGITAINKATKEPIQFEDNVSIGDKNYDNVFYLKPEETAQFSGLQSNRKYYVTEIGVNPGEYDQIIINGTQIVSIDDDGDVSKITDITSEGEQVGNRPSITFQNNCSAKNSRELRITKQMASGQTTTDTFAFQVWLEGTDGSQTPYNGQYYLTKIIDGKKVYYHYDDQGQLVPYEGNEKSLVCGTTTDGIISGVPVGYTVAITKILSETSFLVNEVNLGDNYLPPDKELQEGTYTVEKKEEWADGEILLGTDAEITITNRQKQKLQVSKQWIGENIDPEINVYIGLYKDGVATGQSRVLNADNGWKTQFEGIDSSYTVKELRLVTGGEVAEFTIDGNSYIGINEGEATIIGNNRYEVGYEGPTQDPDNQLNCTIKNIQSWQIVKRSSSEGNPILGGAEFKLSGSTGQFIGTSGADGVVQWKNSNGDSVKIIPDGTYMLEEEKAPQGYVKGQSWTIEIENGFPISIVGTQGEGLPESKVPVGEVNFYKQEGILTLYYDNDTLYELPEAGGPGTFGYTIGGVLLLMAGTLILYKLKDREVLKK